MSGDPQQYRDFIATQIAGAHRMLEHAAIDICCLEDAELFAHYRMALAHMKAGLATFPDLRAALDATREPA